MATPLRDQLRAVIAEIGEIDDPQTITDDADLYADLGLDSMQALEIALEMERRLGLSISEAQLAKIRSLGDALKLAEELGKKP